MSSGHRSAIADSRPTSDPPTSQQRTSELLAEQVRRGFSEGRAFAAVSRIGLVVAPLAVYVAIALSAQAGAWRTLAGSVSLVFGMAMAGALNDLADQRSDSLGNKHHRVLVGGGITHSQACRFASFMALASLGWAIPLAQPVGLVVFGTGAVGAWAYSLPPVRLKARGFLGTIDLAVCYLALPLVLGLGQSPGDVPRSRVALLSLGLVVCAQGVVWHKDVVDLDCDRATGTRTPVVRHGARKLGTRAPSLVVAGSVMIVGAAGTVSLLTIAGPVWLLAVTAVIARSGVSARRANCARWALVIVAASSGAVLANV